MKTREPISSSKTARALFIALAVGASVLAAPAAARADFHGVDDKTVFQIKGKGTYVEHVRARARNFSGFHGFFNISGAVSGVSATRDWSGVSDDYFVIGVNRHLPHGSEVCAQGWEGTANPFRSVGRVCGTILR